VPVLLTLLLWNGLPVVGRADEIASLPEGVIALLRPKESGHGVEPREYYAYIGSVAFSPDGKIIASGSHSGVCLWEPTGKGSIRRLTPNTKPFFNVRVIRFTSGGKQLVTGSQDGTVRSWDVITGQELGCVRIGWADVTGHVALDRDAQTIAAADCSTSIYLHDGKTGKELRRCEGHKRGIDGIALSDDGKLMASADWDGNLRLWDTATGKERPHLPGSEKAGEPSLSADGRLVAGTVPGQQLRVWDTVTGQLVRKIPVEKPFPRSAFSPDGRVVAAAGKGLIQLFEVATGKERWRLKTDDESVYSLVFSPDSTQLAGGDWGGTVWLYDATGRSKAPGAAAPLSPAELEALWSDLASPDGRRAGRAVRTLIDASAASVGLLNSRLRPARVDAGEVARLVKDLDNDTFAVREKATASLEAIADSAEGELQRVLKAAPSPEVRRRLEALLERARQRPLANEEARELRAVEVLEHVATPKARKLLETLATGVPEARLTREAVASLQRLDGRPSGAGVNDRR
jgi:hypothetical protein